jgi:sulfate permease, SulP family
LQSSSEIKQRAHAAGIERVILRLKRVRNPDVMSLEQFEHFLKETDGLKVWLAGVQPDLIAAFQRLDFPSWLDEDRIFPQGADEDSATLAAIRRVRAELKAQLPEATRNLYYLV